MDDITVTIDGIEVSGFENQTILEAAKQARIEIPTLCYHPDLTPDGSCRICVVEVEGYNALVGACHTPIAEGMVIHTRTPRVLSARKATIELLLAAHRGPCVTDTHAKACELHQLAAKLGVGAPRFRVRQQRTYPIETISPYVHRDMSRCILCNRCVRACSEIAKQRVFSKAYRGFDSKITVDMDEPLDKEVCRDCQICIEYCPTGALIKPEST